MEELDALDVDDSDLPLLLRPCKRQRHCNQSPTKCTTSSQSLRLRPLTFQSQNLDSHSSQTHHFISSSVHPPSPTAPSRLVPGPAGAVQAAMHRRTSYLAQMSCGREDIIPTQDYLRKVVEEGEGLEDDDFQRNPWRCAVDLARPNELGDGGAIGTPLSAIKNCQNTEKIPQVVAIIKSCASNGLGDLMVTLKDPTGTIGASVHKKVITEGEFGRDVTVGSVLILKNVAVFCFSRATHYLNITLNNVIKIIPKDTESSPPQNYPAFRFEHGSSRTDSLTRPNSLESPEKSPSFVPEKTQSILLGPRKGTSFAESDPEEITATQIEKDGNYKDQAIAVDKQLIATPSLRQWTEEQLDALFADVDGIDDF